MIRMINPPTMTGVKVDAYIVIDEYTVKSRTKSPYLNVSRLVL